MIEFEYEISLFTDTAAVGLRDFTTVPLDVILTFANLQLGQLLNGAGINVTGGSQVQPYVVGVALPCFFVSLSSPLANTSLSTLQAHAKWRLFWWLSNALNGDRPVVGYSFSDMTSSQSSTCLAANFQWVGDVFTAGYVDALRPLGTKQVIADMQSQLIAQWIGLFSEQLWMDPATRQASLYKLNNISFELGGAAVQPGYDTIDISANNSFLQNMLTVASLTSHNQWASLQNVAVKSPSFQASTFVAQNYDYFNTVQLSAYIMQNPVFNTSQSTVLNWARLGVIMGHEIGHAFDSISNNINTQFGSWSTSSSAAFAAETQCLVQQYDNTSYTLNLARWGDDFNDFPIIDAHIKGSMTLGENIADYGGVHAAYNAYRAALGSIATTFTDQQFFTGYAQVWCRDIDDYTLWDALKRDPHAPGSARINNVLSMSKPFATAFGCPVGSPMNPTLNKCTLYN